MKGNGSELLETHCSNGVPLTLASVGMAEVKGPPSSHHRINSFFGSRCPKLCDTGWVSNIFSRCSPRFLGKMNPF